MIVDNEEFYEQEKPLSLEDIRCLIIILRQVILVISSSSIARGGEKNVITEELNGHHFARWWHFLKYSMVTELVFIFNMIIDYCEF